MKPVERVEARGGLRSSEGPGAGFSAIKAGIQGLLPELKTNGDLRREAVFRLMLIQKWVNGLMS